MKKLLFISILLITTYSIISCSKDNDSPVTEEPKPTSKMSVTIDGINKTFNVISVSDYVQSGQNYTRITASNNPSNNATIEFNIYKNQTGLGAKFYIVTMNNGQEGSDSYLGEPNEIDLNITTNNSTKITGVFSGDIAWQSNSSSGVSIITNGSFEFYY